MDPEGTGFLLQHIPWHLVPSGLARSPHLKALRLVSVSCLWGLCQVSLLQSGFTEFVWGL